MVVGTVVAVAVVATGGAAAAAGAAFGSAAGLGAGAAAGTTSAVGAAVGGSIAGGAIAGAAYGGATGAAIGAVAGGTSAVGVGASTVAGAALLTGPFGWIVVGTADNSDDKGLTFDCWKPVVHETSMEPSNGILLKDLIGHPKIASVHITGDAHTMDDLPDIFITNIWDEKFQVDYLRIIETNEIVCHARPLVA